MTDNERLRTMNEALRAMINQHTCVIAGVRYQFRLDWWAKEKDADLAQARKLLNVECIASEAGQHRAPLHILVSVGHLAEVPAMLDDALVVHLSHPEIEEGSRSLDGYWSIAAPL